MLDKGKMPPSYYLPLHPEARLSPQDKRELVDGLRKTFGGGGGHREGGAGAEETARPQ